MHYICICMIVSFRSLIHVHSMTMAWKYGKHDVASFGKVTMELRLICPIWHYYDDDWYHMHISWVGLICIDVVMLFMTTTCDDDHDVEWCDDVCVSCLWWWFMMMMHDDEWNTKWDNWSMILCLYFACSLLYFRLDCFDISPLCFVGPLSLYWQCADNSK